MVSKKVRIYRYLLIAFLIIVLWFMCKIIGCGNSNKQILSLTESTQFYGISELFLFV
jgi:hypothetical protein